MSHRKTSTSQDRIVAHVDGCFIPETRKHYAKGGIGVWFRKDYALNEYRSINGFGKTSNDIEMEAAQRAIDIVEGNGYAVVVCTNSQYVLQNQHKLIRRYEGTIIRRKDPNSPPMRQAHDLAELAANMC